MPTLASRTQHAIRLLALIAGSGVEASDPGDPPGAVLALRSELRLQALDFWLRNPDYLADELLTEIDEGRLDASYERVAESLLNDPEPKLHHYPMPRWFRGAYEPLDDAFGQLVTYGLGLLSREEVPVHRNQFFLTAAGVEAAREIAHSTTPLGWYAHQVRLVLAVAHGQSGSSLKARQYKRAEYAGTELGTVIASIEPLVRRRLLARRQAS